MIEREELIRKKELPIEKEREYYGRCYWLYRLLRKEGELSRVVKICEREFKIRSLTEKEILESAVPCFYFIGSLYLFPNSPVSASERTGYSLRTVQNINAILATYGFIKRTENGYMFKDKERAIKFLSEFEKVKDKVIKRLNKYLLAVEMQEEYSLGEISERLEINYQTLLNWLNYNKKPMGFPLPEGVAEILNLPKELYEKAKKHELIVSKVEEEEELELEEE